MIEILRKRRSIRSYTTEGVDREAVALLLEAVLRAPSSRDLKPWEFVLVDDPELLAQLSQAKEHGSQFLKGAPLAIVVCADPQKCDVWVEDCSIAAIVAQLVAESLDLGSCWIQIRSRQHDATQSAEEYVREVLGLPPHLQVASIIGIGHPSARKQPVPADKLEYAKVKHNSYAKPWR